MAEDSSACLSQALQVLKENWGEIQPSTCLICGSGWGDIVQNLSPVSSIPYDNLLGLGKTTVQGHSGKLWLTKPSGHQVLVFQGRRHWYEGDGWAPVIFPGLLAHGVGARNLLLTNAAGGICKDLVPGDLMVITDHINFMGSNPLIGQVPHPSITRFPDQSQVYDLSLRKKIHEAGKKLGLDLKDGTYIGLSGPAFETPAEIRAFSHLGADAVGMSTVPEAMVANALGLRVGAVSCISNLAAGLSGIPLSHEEVEETSKEVLPKMSELLTHLFAILAD